MIRLRCESRGILMSQEKNRKTGYPHIDKPWLDSYPKDALNQKYHDESIYDFFKRCNMSRQDNIATEFYGYKIKYGQMFENPGWTESNFCRDSCPIIHEIQECRKLL